MSPPGANVPEDTETRLTRVEERVKDHTEQLRVLGPLVAGHAVISERYDNLRDDLNKGLDAIRAEIHEIKKDQFEKAKERRTMLVALFVAGVGLFGTFGAQLMQLRGK